MSDIVLNRTRFPDKVYACWMGKNIGGTLGAPWECIRDAHALTFYDPVPDSAAPNNDLDLQLMWLKMLEEEGLDPSVRTFAENWKRYASRYPRNEYGFFMRNCETNINSRRCGRSVRWELTPATSQFRKRLCRASAGRTVNESWSPGKAIPS